MALTRLLSSHNKSVCTVEEETCLLRKFSSSLLRSVSRVPSRSSANWRTLRGTQRSTDPSRSGTQQPVSPASTAAFDSELEPVLCFRYAPVCKRLQILQRKDFREIPYGCARLLSQCSQTAACPCMPIRLLMNTHIAYNWSTKFLKSRKRTCVTIKAHGGHAGAEITSRTKTRWFRKQVLPP